LTQTTGNGHPRVIEAIKHAIDLESKGQTGLAAQHLSVLLAEFPTAASIHGYLAWFLSRSGQFDKAIENGATTGDVNGTLRQSPVACGRMNGVALCVGLGKRRKPHPRHPTRSGSNWDTMWPINISLLE
jgi:hypothetical protein